ncbi:hypothetical protein GN956_G14651 [Arapaima gigas]
MQDEHEPVSRRLQASRKPVGNPVACETHRRDRRDCSQERKNKLTAFQQGGGDSWPTLSSSASIAVAASAKWGALDPCRHLTLPQGIG